MFDGMDEDEAPKKKVEVIDVPVLTERDRAKIERRKRKDERQREGVPEQKLRSHLGSLGVTALLGTLLFNQCILYLDLDAVEALIQGLVLFQGGVLMVSHDEHLISGSVDELWVVSDGRITPFHGTFADYKKILQSS